jgi:hypothetical protein
MTDEPRGVAIHGMFSDSEGCRGTFYDAGRIDCPRCEELGGWDGKDSGLHCPYGCGVRVISVQAEATERYNAESRVREQIRRDVRMLRKAQKA